MNFGFPVFLDVAGKKCLVTGEGVEVAGKIGALLYCGAKVTYVNPEAEEAIAALAAENSIVWEQRSFLPGDLSECFLVITDRDDNSEVFRMAEEERVLCNSVDDPRHCRFSFGSVHRQGDLTIAISSNGWAPAVAVRIRQLLEREIGPEYGELLTLLKRVRPEIAKRIRDFAMRRDLWYSLVDSPALQRLRKGQRAEAKQIIRRLIEEAVSNISSSQTSGDSGSP